MMLGHKGGRSDFEKTQLALMRTVKRLGYDKMPLNDETWRPFLALLWGFAEAKGEMITIIDIGDKPGRLYCALVSEDAIKLKWFSDELQAALLKTFSREHIARAIPVFQLGKISVLYFEGIWTPVEALDGRKH